MPGYDKRAVPGAPLRDSTLTDLAGRGLRPQRAAAPRRLVALTAVGHGPRSRLPRALRGSLVPECDRDVVARRVRPAATGCGGPRGRDGRRAERDHADRRAVRGQRHGRRGPLGGRPALRDRAGRRPAVLRPPAGGAAPARSPTSRPAWRRGPARRRGGAGPPRRAVPRPRRGAGPHPLRQLRRRGPHAGAPGPPGGAQGLRQPAGGRSARRRRPPAPPVARVRRPRRPDLRPGRRRRPADRPVRGARGGPRRAPVQALRPHASAPARPGWRRSPGGWAPIRRRSTPRWRTPAWLPTGGAGPSSPALPPGRTAAERSRCRSTSRPGPRTSIRRPWPPSPGSWPGATATAEGFAALTRAMAAAGPGGGFAVTVVGVGLAPGGGVGKVNVYAAPTAAPDPAGRGARPSCQWVGESARH